MPNRLLCTDTIWSIMLYMLWDHFLKHFALLIAPYLNSLFALSNRLVCSSIFPYSLLLCEFCVHQFSIFVLVLLQDSSIFLMHACCNCVTSPIFPVCCLVCVFIICPQHVRFVTFIFDLSIFLMHVCDF